MDRNFFVAFFAVLLPFLNVAAATPQHGKRVVCNMDQWAVSSWLMGGPTHTYTQLGGPFDPLDALNAAQFCTHIVVTAAYCNYETLSLTPQAANHTSGRVGLYEAIKLKVDHPRLKIILGLITEYPWKEKHSRILADGDARKKFSKNVAAFLSKNSLDGIDFPYSSYLIGDKSSVADRTNYISLMQEVGRALDEENQQLTISIGAFKFDFPEGMNVKSLSEHAHYLNVMTFNYWSFRNGQVGSSAPLYGDQPFSFLTDTISRYLDLGAEPFKLNMGLAPYGAAFVLTDASIADAAIMAAPVKGTFNGRYKHSDGILGFHELCWEMENGNWTEIWDDTSRTPLARNAEKVASFENSRSYTAKVKFAIEKKLGGVMFATLAKDDFKGRCASSNGPYPQLRDINQAISRYTLHKYEDINNLLHTKDVKYFWNSMIEK